MSATTRDLFDAATNGAQPATPGSYGEPPHRGHRLPAATGLGPVRLQVADLGRSLAFYQGVLGFEALAHDAGRATLGAPASAADGPAPPARASARASAQATELVELVERPGARPAPPRGRLGLYHVAYLLPDRPALGRFARHLAARGVRAGASDHLVSEAFYLTDPDGLGIEVYADRPRSAWGRVGRELTMATDPIDLPGLMRAADEAAGGTAAPWTGAPARTVVGHVHLHVGDTTQADAFYAEGLGFDRTVWRYPGAHFFGAGGYHHHLGTNTWAGAAARPPADGDAQLLEWTVELPAAADVAAAAASLAAAGHAAEWAPDGSAVAPDPWGTAVRLRTPRPVTAP